MYADRDPNRFKTERVYNRTDRAVSVRFDGLDEVWAPREERWVPAAMAYHARKHSPALEDPTTGAVETKLVILQRDEPLPPLLGAEVLDRGELIVRDDLDPQVDDAGHPLRPELRQLRPDRREILGIAPGMSRQAREKSGEITKTTEEFHQDLEDSGAHEAFAAAAKMVPDEALEPARG